MAPWAATLTDATIRIGFDKLAGFEPPLQALGASGYLTEAEFGRSAASTPFALAPGQMWMTSFMTDDLATCPVISFGASAQGVTGCASLDAGGWMFLAAASVPEPVCAWLWAAGLGLLAGRRLAARASSRPE